MVLFRFASSCVYRFKSWVWRIRTFLSLCPRIVWKRKRTTWRALLPRWRGSPRAVMGIWPNPLRSVRPARRLCTRPLAIGSVLIAICPSNSTSGPMWCGGNLSTPHPFCDPANSCGKKDTRPTPRTTMPTPWSNKPSICTAVSTKTCWPSPSLRDTRRKRKNLPVDTKPPRSKRTFPLPGGPFREPPRTTSDKTLAKCLTFTFKTKRAKPKLPGKPRGDSPPAPLVS